ncbi:cytosine deaminase [Roseomonas vastitatis]|uniref:Cytosine deaminase n=2 Tax=Teichococcus vastitatis TaxID=2307076 RepID=A0ABS9W8M9_9PROT|nr:cytosine deaminase [Pseudoroseomonas vastitatis]MCI0755643.1 cytosine deaminase [Pseudoroseomonas vastitatis]
MTWAPVLPPTGSFWLRNACAPASLAPEAPAGTEKQDGLLRLDILVEGGQVGALALAGTATDGVDLDGGQVWPGFLDAHTHLDKGHIWPRAANQDGTFPGALAAVRADRTSLWSEADMEARADFALRCALAHGTVALRTHLDTYLPHAATTWRLFRRLREQWAGRIDLQASSLTSVEDLDGDHGTDIANMVADAGGNLGAVAHVSGNADTPLPPGYVERLNRIFMLAEDRGLDLDFHVDESGEAGARALRAIAETALRRRFRNRVLCGHCCSLAMQPDDYAAKTVALCAEAGIAIVVLPMCNMYLQDRIPGRTPRWRGVTLVHEMQAAGIPVSFASDNTRDPFYAYGDLDMLEVFRESVRIMQLDHPVDGWPAAVTTIPAEVMRLPYRGLLRTGAPADLVLFRGREWTELLARPQSDRIVLRAGRRLNAVLPDWRELDPYVSGR